MLTLLVLLALPPALLIRYFHGPVDWITALAYYLIAWIGTMSILTLLSQFFPIGIAQSPIPEVTATLASALAAWELAVSGEWSLLEQKTEKQALPKTRYIPYN